MTDDNDNDKENWVNSETDIVVGGESIGTVKNVSMELEEPRDDIVGFAEYDPTREYTGSFTLRRDMVDDVSTDIIDTLVERRLTESEALLRSAFLFGYALGKAE